MRREALQRVSPDLLADIVTSACDIALVVSPGRVVESVMVSPQFGSAERFAVWQGARLSQLFSPESAQKLENRLAEGPEPGRSLQLELTHSAEAFTLPVRYTITRSGEDGTLLLIGRDMQPLAELQQQLVKAQLALERDYEAQREIETRYRVLLEAHPAPLLIVSMSTGRIADLNLAAAEMIGATRAELIDAPVGQELDGRRRGEFLENLAKLAGSDPLGGVELTVRRSRRKVTVTATLFRAAGDRLLLCRLGEAEARRTRVDDTVELSERLFLKGIDAMVFLDAEGTIRAANDAFLYLTDAGSAALVQGRSFADFLSRGAIDLNVLLDNVKRIGHLRHYVTRLNTDFSGQVTVELSATLFRDRATPTIALVIRDSNLADATRIMPGMASNEGLRNVMQMVGYATLRDIVSETTEIIEKMCIETALELTGNNRVAAAELLSLSRQSLYVKLRKFGLLSKDAE
ncbi:transcriptional regulator PpsR [Rhodobacter capsulatus]|uniref:Transcriptional regulator PpsR n=1 Tax=Rhodobacter capsulatus TaxID=1061 RepID=A0A1G7GF31_RHOCA|nr:transcriptional regulator PpsR [Rhodobacter capsulatus]WER10050.1 transcriptional regulator PpsR [Rhodobacter capsulatus]SDE86742.1 transcriptional regulator PpsR [Rhodobacter capsulatus]